MNTEHQNIMWIAIEQGKSNLHAWAMQGDTVLAHRSGAPTGPVPGDLRESDLLALSQDWLGDQPMLTLICGETGLAKIPVPRAVKALSPQRFPTNDPRIRAFGLPGLVQDKPSDVMQSDAVRIAGFLSLNPGWDGVICQPGPKTSWSQVSAGEVVSFQSFLSMDLAGVLAHRLKIASDGFAGLNGDPAAFETALDNALARPERLAHVLNGLALTDPQFAQSDPQKQAQLWGALIGAELAAARRYWLGQQVAVVGPGDVSRPYVSGLQRQGVSPTIADDMRMLVAGLNAARKRIA